ncbi:transporter substrate-binding domain-containing protein [Metapseudomonas otitidis]|uniref:transporter substrate-binding domain-containing protein n=1 Tax=Metapseudomonas otitidis TaxID=319939 RepID=UPI0013F69210|nr:transporter substrate-binding domain-containing protein [Pseudomonas otitidis]
MRLLYCLLFLLPLASPSARADLIDDVWERGSLRIAVVENDAPFALRNGEQLQGYGIDLGNALADELNVKADFIPVSADALMETLRSGKVDIALGSALDAAGDDPQLELSEPYTASPAPSASTNTPAQSLAPSHAEPATPATGIPFRRDNPAFRSALNNALGKLRGNGHLEHLSQKWHDGGKAPIPTAPQSEPASTTDSTPEPAASE